MLLAAVVILAAGAIAYSNSFRGVFVYDDPASIRDNPNIRSLWPLGEALDAPPEASVSGRPVASLSLAVNYALAPVADREVMVPSGESAVANASSRFYRNVWGYHLTNLLIHLGAALAFFGVVRRSLMSDRVAFAPASATFVAAAAGLIWTVHPLQTESVTYIVQRTESLMGLFFFLTLYCAIRAVRQESARRWWVAASITSCALGMGSKEVMVGAPLMVALWDYLFGVRFTARRGLYLGLASTWLVLIALVASETRPSSVGFELGWTWWSYLLTQAGVVAHYLRLSFVPMPLVFEYGWPAAESARAVAVPAALVFALAAATVLALWKRHPLALLGAWFFVILAPTSSVLPIVTEVAAEHRMYLPLAAVVVAAVLVAHTSGTWVRQRAGIDAMWLTAAGTVVVVLVSVALASATRSRNEVYWSEETLWLDTIAKRPANARARVAYATTLLAQRRFAEAETALRIAVDLDDRSSRAHLNLGSALSAQGEFEEGIRHFERAIALNPDLDEPYALLGETYARLGRMSRAMPWFDQALERLPDNPFLLKRVAWLLATVDDDDVRSGPRAVSLAERAVVLTRRQDAVALDTLAAAYAEVGRFAEAVTAAETAIALATTQGDGMVAEVRARLALYQAGRSLRQGPGDLPPGSP